MHEVALMQNVLEVALENAQRQNATAIHAVRLRVGALSGAVPEALEFAFEVLVRGTIAEGARLEIEKVPALCHCSSCKIDFEPDPVVFACPQCGQPSATIQKGRELEIVSLEIT